MPTINGTIEAIAAINGNNIGLGIPSKKNVIAIILPTSIAVRSYQEIGY